MRKRRKRERSTNYSSGIYKIENTENGKVYIGSSNGIERRMNNHKKRLEENSHRNAELQKDWNIYGEDKFTFEILEIENDPLKLPQKEYDYIISYHELNGVYNRSNPLYEHIRGRFEKKKDNDIKNKIKVKNRYSQKYILNWLDENLKNKIELMIDNIEDNIYFEKSPVDDWIIKDITDDDIKNSDKIISTIKRWYNKNGFYVVSARMYHNELRFLCKKEITTTDEIIVSAEVNKLLYENKFKRNKNKI